MLTKQQVIERLCKLATKVGEDAFDNMKAHDCFCGENHLVDTPANEFRFEEDVIAYIESAVGYKLSEITNEQFKMLAQGKEYSVKMNSPNSWYVSVKEGEWGDVVNSAILEEIRERIEYVYGEVGYITGIE